MGVFEDNRLGFVFEVGFNIGLLSKLKEYKDDGRVKINDFFLDFMKAKLNEKQYCRERFYKIFTKETFDSNIKEELKRNIDYLLFKGIISGQNFFKEFIDSKVKEGKDFEVVYFQVDFNNPLNLELFGEKECDYYNKLIDKQLKISIQKDKLNEYLGKGEFLRADSLFMIKVRSKYHLCVVDNGISLNNISQLSNLETLKKKYVKTINKVRGKSVFSDLTLEGANIDFMIGKNLSDFASARGSRDKPLIKMIQAGSYAYSFINFLFKYNYLQKDEITSINITGYTDEEVGSINISNENYKLIDEIKSCYVELLPFYEDYKSCDRKNEYSKYEEKQEMLFRNIRRNFKKAFNIKRVFGAEDSFMKKDNLDLDEYLNNENKVQVEEAFKIQDNFKNLTKLGDGINIKSLDEVIEGYQNTADNYKLKGKEMSFRDCHAEEINEYLNKKDIPMVFLTGNPGIGKTTAVINYLENQDSYMFLYISPRIQVNKDIENKLKNDDEIFKDNEVVYLTASGSDEGYINDEHVDIVNYSSNSDKYESIKKPILFLKNDREREFHNESVKFKELNSTDFTSKKDNKKGVLNRLTTAVNYVVENNLSNKIVATAAVQSLKTIGNSGTTAKHFSNIFNSIYNSKSQTIDIEATKIFARKFKNVIFMIDEITGAESGVQFLDELINKVYKNIFLKIPEEIKKNINFKIIVADASVTDENVINRHINKANVDNDKIYFSSGFNDIEPLITEEFIFKNKYKSVIINTNSYPAKRLHIKYRPCIHIARDDDFKVVDLKDTVDTLIVQDAIEYLLEKKHEQVIIYIQDISRLDSIKGQIINEYYYRTKTNLDKEKDILIINSAMNKYDRNNVNTLKKDAKFILMTASASRGISFPKVTAILVDVPRFNVEMNLMEIVQLVYRGRGDSYIDINSEKFINFYLAEKILYDEDRERQISSGLLSMLSLMIILKASVLTRIQGFTDISGKRISVIPIGGKGVNGVGELVVEEIRHLINNLHKEYCKDKSQVNIKILSENLMSIFDSIKIKTDNSIFNIDINKIKTNYYDLWDEGLFKLIDFKPFHNAMVIGDIGIFKVNNDFNGHTSFDRNKIDKSNKLNKLMNTLYAMSKDEKSYTDALRKQMARTYSLLKNVISSEEEISKNMIEKNNHDDRYIAVPLISPFLLKEFKGYYKHEEIENCFKDIIESYVKSYYSINSVLPITSEYVDYPYISFRSSTLEPIRKKKFHDKYIFCSKEINLINLLLTV